MFLRASPEYYRKAAAECVFQGRVAEALGDEQWRDYWWSIAAEYAAEAADGWRRVRRRAGATGYFHKGDGHEHA